MGARTYPFFLRPLPFFFSRGTQRFFPPPPQSPFPAQMILVFNHQLSNLRIYAPFFHFANIPRTPGPQNLPALRAYFCVFPPAFLISVHGSYFKTTIYPLLFFPRWLKHERGSFLHFPLVLGTFVEATPRRLKNLTPGVPERFPFFPPIFCTGLIYTQGL